MIRYNYYVNSEVDMQYIADTLGIEMSTETWNSAGKLPYYLVDRYDFIKAILEGVPCLLMKPKGELETLTAIKKHIAKVNEVEQIPVVLNLNAVNARRRKSLIDARIPFVAPACQIYLPFMGVALSERYSSVKVPATILMPSSQLILFHYLYSEDAELQVGETAGLFSISAMQVSRAVKQLTALGLVLSRKDGVRTILSSIEPRSILFEKAKPHILNPVRKRIYIETVDLPKGLPLSGNSALSEMTMLGGTGTDTYAYYGSADELTGVETLADNTRQTEVEIWRYNPALLSKRLGVVDALSLIASLPSDDDPRVEQAVDELLLRIWG